MDVHSGVKFSTAWLLHIQLEIPHTTKARI